MSSPLPNITDETFGSFFFNTPEQFAAKLPVQGLLPGSLYFVNETLYLAISTDTATKFGDFRKVQQLPSASSAIKDLLYCGLNAGDKSVLAVSDGSSWRYLNESTTLSVSDGVMTFKTTTFDGDGQPVTSTFTYTPPVFEVGSGSADELLNATASGAVKRSGFFASDENIPATGGATKLPTQRAVSALVKESGDTLAEKVTGELRQIIEDLESDTAEELLKFVKRLTSAEGYSVDKIGEILLAAEEGWYKLSGARLTQSIEAGVTDPEELSHSKFPSERAIAVWVLQQLETVRKGARFRDTIDLTNAASTFASAHAEDPIKQGDFWLVEAGGTFLGVEFKTGDTLQFKNDVESLPIAAGDFAKIPYVGVELAFALDDNARTKGASAELTYLLNRLKMTRIGVNALDGSHAGITGEQIPVTLPDGNIKSSGKSFVEEMDLESPSDAKVPTEKAIVHQLASAIGEAVAHFRWRTD